MERSRFSGQRRSQMEIMGLMVVVILLIIGVLFAVKFVVLKKPPETRQQYTRTQLASNLGLAILESTTRDCRGTAIKDLLMDCAEWESITCDNREPSCTYVNKTIVRMLNETLVAWKTPFEVKAWSRPGEYKLYVNNLGCHDNKPGEAESFFLPAGGAGLLTLKIYICE